jgi:uncharacterized protein (TIGR03118 family)
VTDIGGNVYVTYAPSGHAAQTTAGLGDGAVAVFTESGQLELSKTLLGGPHTPLASPWGVVVAPSDWGQFSGDLLVGNFSNLHSEINAFDPKTGRFEGTISISAGSGNTPGGLWDLTFGGGGSNGSPSTLYFTDGIAGETHVFSARSRAWGCPLGALCVGAGLANAQYRQTDLVSDIPGLATVTDLNLKNPWGVSFLPGSPIWVSNQGTNTATLYPVMGSIGVSPTPFTVNIPPTGGLGPTGQVANAGMMGFNVVGGNGAPADFIFANLNGSISAWNGAPLTQAFTQVTTPGASYTGLAINTTNTRLFAANDNGSGSIDVFNSSFAPVSGAGFMTPAAIAAAKLVPFDVKDIGGNVFVTYAPMGHIPQTLAAPGDGAVAEFNETTGALESMSTPSADSKFASPWGIALAPLSFGKFGGDLLVGNFAFGDSVINAFNPMNWDFEGSISINDGGQMPGGLWSLAFGGNAGSPDNDGNANTLFFTDGLNSEKDGLFGAITVPEPSTWAMMLLGFGGLALLAGLRKRASLAGA